MPEKFNKDYIIKNEKIDKNNIYKIIIEYFAIILPAIVSIGYFTAYMYEKSYLDYFEIPISNLKISTELVIRSSITYLALLYLGIFFLLYGYMINFVFKYIRTLLVLRNNPGKHKFRILKIIIIIFPLVFILISAIYLVLLTICKMIKCQYIINSFIPFNMTIPYIDTIRYQGDTIYNILVLLTFVFVIIFFIITLIHGEFMEYVNKVSYKVIDSFNLFHYFIIYLIFLTIAFNSSSYGNIEVKTSTTYDTFTYNKKNYILLPNMTVNRIGVLFNKDTKTFENKYIILTDLNKIEIENEDIGPLIKKNVVITKETKQKLHKK